MSHSEEGDNYWPGYVDALTSMVQVLAFIMMMLAMAVFMLSQSVSKSAVEAIAQAVKADVKPNSDMKQLMQAVMDKVQSLASGGPTSDTSAGASAKESATPPSTETEAAREFAAERRGTMRLSAERARKDQAAAPPPSNAPRLTVGFDERSFKIDQNRAQTMSQFVETNKVVERAAGIVIHGYAYSGDGALTEARRLAYYRAMMARKQLVDAKVKPDDIRINVTDTDEKSHGSTIDLVVVAGGGAN